jgi:hypothetical protein
MELVLERAKASRRREGDLVRAILDFLASRRIWAMRLNTGAARYRNRDGSTRLVRFGRKGAPDILAIAPVKGQRWGVAVLIEAKRTGQSPDRLQVFRIGQLNDSGALAFSATSLEEVRQVLTEAGIISR